MKRDTSLTSDTSLDSDYKFPKPDGPPERPGWHSPNPAGAYRWTLLQPQNLRPDWCRGCWPSHSCPAQNQAWYSSQLWWENFLKPLCSGSFFRDNCGASCPSPWTPVSPPSVRGLSLWLPRLFGSRVNLSKYPYVEDESLNCSKSENTEYIDPSLYTGLKFCSLVLMCRWHCLIMNISTATAVSLVMALIFYAVKFCKSHFTDQDTEAGLVK